MNMGMEPSNMDCGISEDRRSQVTESYDALDKSIVCLQKHLDELSIRLTSVMLAESPLCVNEKECRDAYVPLADKIFSARSRVLRLGDKVQDILARLEL